MSGSARLVDSDRAAITELAPVLRRAVDLDARTLARLRFTTGAATTGAATGSPAAPTAAATSEDPVATVLVRLPFDILVSRTVRQDAQSTSTTHPATGLPRDLCVAAAELLAWSDGGPHPVSRDADWRGGLPPARGWRRLDTVPDDVLRPLVRQGALTLRQAAAREGVPRAEPRRAVADVLLDTVVLDVSDPSGMHAGVTLRALSALTRMGFLPRGGQAHIDVAGRWIRVVGGYGTVYLVRPGGGLGLIG